MVMVTRTRTEFPSYTLPAHLHAIHEEASPVLDATILDGPAANINMPTHFQQSQSHDSYPGSHTFFPHGPHTWQDFSSAPNTTSFDAINQHHGGFTDQPSHDFHRAQVADFAAHTTSWQQPAGGFASIPHASLYAPYPPHTVVKGEEPFQVGAAHAPHPQANGLPVSTATSQPQSTASATSPQSETGWMSTSSSDRTPKREQLSPLFDLNPPTLRRDGVRKKNARFEIPEDRKVETIDKIIMEADPNDEKLIKELKAQKRLLRNRQAAYVLSSIFLTNRRLTCTQARLSLPQEGAYFEIRRGEETPEPAAGPTA